MNGEISPDVVRLKCRYYGECKYSVVADEPFIHTNYKQHLREQHKVEHPKVEPEEIKPL